MTCKLLIPAFTLPPPRLPPNKHRSPHNHRQKHPNPEKRKRPAVIRSIDEMLHGEGDGEVDHGRANG